MASKTSLRRAFLGSAYAVLAVFIMLSLATCDLFKVGLGEKVDINPPEIAIISPVSGAYTNGNITVTGTVSDDLGVSTVTVYADGQAYPAAVTNGNWSVTLPVESKAGSGVGLPDGKKTLSAVAIDQSGKTRTAETIVNVDNIGPFVLLSVPQGYGSAASTYSGYIDFKGETWDPSPISKVEVVVIDPTTKAEIKRKEAQGTNTWSVRFTIGTGDDLPFTSAQSGNRYEFFVEATDAAGNRNTYAFHSQDIYALMTTRSIERFPVTSELGAMDQGKRDSVLVDLNGLTYTELSSKRIDEAPFSGTMSDFKYDSDGTKPVITFTNIDPSNPVETNVVGSKTPILGSVSPGPAGTTVDGNSIQSTLYPLSPAGASFVITPTLNPIGSTVNFQFALKQGSSYLPNGRYRITVTAQAAGGSIANPVSVDFLIDNNVPQYVRLAPSDNAFASRIDLGDGKGMGVRLNVIVNDDNDTTDGIAHSSLTQAVASATDSGAALPGVTIADGGDVVESGSRIGRLWIVDVPYSTGTELYLDYTARDSGGSVATRSHHVTIDETPPTATISDPPSETLPVGALLSADSFIFRGAATDSQSGIEEVRWWLGARDGSDLPASTSNWHLASGLGSWSATQDFTSVAEGQKRLSVRTRDSAGNWSATASVDFTYDKANPIATMTVGSTAKGYVEGGVEYREGGFALGGDCDDDTATNGRRATSVSLSVSKDGAAPSGLVLTSGGASTGAWTYTQTANAVSHADDGLYVYVLTVTDEAGRTGSVTKTVRIDTTPPTVGISAPVSGEALEVANYTLRGSAYDLGAGFDSSTLRYVLNGTEKAPTLVGQGWTASEPLGSEGAFTLTAKGTDKLGNSFETPEITFYYDMAKPTLTETTVGVDGRLTNVAFSLGGQVHDSNALKDLTIKAEKDGTTVHTWAAIALSGQDQSWSLPVNLSDLSGDGTYIFTITARDIANRSSDAVQRTIKVDTTKPVIVTIGLAEGQLLLDSSATILGTASDGEGTGVASVEYSLDAGATWTAANGGSSWAAALSSLTDGLSKSFRIRAVDGAGNVGDPLSRTFRVDLAPPTLDVSGLPEGSTVYRNADVVLSGTSTDANGLASFVVSYSKDGASSVTLSSDLPGAGDAWTATLPVTAGNGSYVITITATDRSGGRQPTTVRRSVVIDTTPPTLEVSAPTGGGLVSSSTITVSGTVEDNAGGRGVTSLEYSLDSTNGSDGTWTSIAFSGYTWSDSSVGIGAAQGPKSLWVRASDGLNAPSTRHVSFTYDAAPPTLTETDSLLTSAQVIRNAAVTFGGQVNDTYALARLELSVNHGTPIVVTTTAGAWNYTLSSTVDGDFDLVFTAFDAAGRQSAAIERRVLMDATKPVKPVFSSTPGAYVENQLVVVGTSSDATSGLEAAYYRLDSGSPDSLVGTSFWSRTVDVSSLSQGTHAITVWTVDLAGNPSDETTQDFVIDRANPTISVDAAFDGVVYRNGGFNVDVTVTDTYGLPASPLTASLKVGGTTTALAAPTCISGAGTASQVWRLAVAAPSDGVYVLTLGASDSVGRLAQSAERTVTVDSDPPEVLINSISPLLSGSVVNGRITMSASASDPSGLDGVRYFVRTISGTPAYDDPDGIALSAPFSVPIDTSGYPDGSLYLTVVARDKAGNVNSHSATVSVLESSDDPVVSISSPVDNDAIGADRMIRGTFMDDDGVASGGAILYVKKSTASSYNSFPIAIAGGASASVSWTVNLLTYLQASGDGLYDLYMRVTDDATRKSGLAAAFTETSVQHFSFDNSPPVVSATLSASPVKGAYRLNEAVTLSWTASDPSGIESQSFEVDGSSTGLGSLLNPSADSFSATYTVPAGTTSGSKTFTLIVTDTAGHSTTRTAIITVDSEPPTVEDALNLNPAFVGFTPNGAFTLRGTAADNRGLASVQVRLTGAGGGSNLDWTNAVLTNGNWSFPIANSATYVPTTGNLGIEVRSIDQAGNESEVRSFSLAVNQSADRPTVALISPVSNTTYGTTVQISGTASDDDALADLDDDGTIDADAITIEYWKTSEPGTVYTRNPTITGSGRSATWNYSIVGLDGADYSVRVRARDDGSVIGDWSATTAFRVNAGVPNLVVGTSFPTYGNNASFAITGTVDDSDGIKYVHARINGGSWVLATASGMTDTNSDGEWDSLATGSVTWTINLGLGSDGLKTIEIEAADGSDSIVTVQRSTTLDSLPPTGSFDAQFRDEPTGSFLDTSLLNRIVRITGTVTELNLRDVDPIEISIEDGVNDGWTPVTGTFVWSHVWTTTGLADSDYTIRLKITDKAGNFTESIVRTVTTRQSADTPVITQAFVSAPTGADAGRNVLGSLLKVSGTITDDDGFASGAVSIFLDGSTSPIAATSTTGTTGTWEYTWSTLSQGEHRLSLRATDRNGAFVNLPETYFIVDNANPVLVLNSPTAGARIRAGTLVISGTASDSGGFDANPLAITLRHSDSGSSLDGDVYTPAVSAGSFSQSIPIDDLVLDGTLYIDFTLTDRSGRQASLTRAVTIDTTAPSLALNSPSNAAYINGLVPVSGTADDLNGLKDVTLQVLDPDTMLPISTLTRSSSTMAAWEFQLNCGTYASSTYGLDVNGDGKLWQVFFRLAATDNSDNVQEYKVGADWPSFFIDTDGDKPMISVTQPKNGEKIGGIINMYGTATDDDGPVMQVEVQIDFNGDGDFADSRDIDGDSSIELGTDTVIFGRTVKIGDAANKWEDESAWYVVPVTNNAWTLELNSYNELYASNTGGTGDIVIRVRSRDKFGLASEISTRTVTLDQTFPRIEGVTPLDQTYQHGTFNLVAAFGDNIDLNIDPTSPSLGKSEIRIAINKSTPVTLTEGTNGTGHPYALTADLADPQNGYDLTYPINTNIYFANSSGILYVDLYVRDESGYTNQKSLSFYVDNQAPTASWSNSTTCPDGSNLRNGMITVNTAGRTYIEGNYGDSGAVSGISHVEVYFEKGNKVQRIRTAAGEWGGTLATETASTETYNLANNEWSTPTDATVPFAANTDLGDDYVIKVDKPTEMSDLNFGTDIDGDTYHEYMGIYEGRARFRAYFDSRYLPDGLVNLHYVVYDLAGNRVHRVRQVFIANNGPVINRIRVGSDLNNSGGVANLSGTGVEEIRDYYYPAGSVDRSDYQKIKNLMLYLNIDGDDPNGTNKGIKLIMVDVYNATGTVRLGNVRTIEPDHALGDDTYTFDLPALPTDPDAAPWTSAYIDGKAEYNLKVIVRDEDDISTSRWVKVSVYDPVDSVPPTVTLNALSQADQDKAAGHLERQVDNTDTWSTIRTSYGPTPDDDPKVSGVLVIKGTAYDENRLTEISVDSENNPAPTLASWSGGHLVSSTPAFTIDSETLGEGGHTVTFTYRWDTSNVEDVAGVDKTASFGARDGAQGSVVAAVQQVDVVPYIKTISRDDSTYNTSRSRLGAYVLRQTESVTVTGFNLFNSTSDTITVPGADPVALSSSASDRFTFILPATASSGSVVVTVSGYPSINNLNDNTKSWNSEYSSSNAASLLWTDDRSIHVWRSDDNQSGTNRGYFTGSIDPEYPAMTIDTAGVLYGSWSNYANSEVYWGTNAAAANKIYESYDPLEHTDIDFGSRQAVVYNANTYGNGTWNQDGAGGVQIWDTQATVNPTDGSAIGNFYDMEELYHDKKLMQFINPRIVTSGGDIHISYYDTDTKALKYAYQSSGSTSTAENTGWINVDGGMDRDDGASTDITYSSATATNVNYTANQNGVTVSSVSVVLGQRVASGTVLATLSNGTQVTATANGYISYIIAKDASTPRWSTTISTLASHTVQSVSASVGASVVTTPTATTILTLANYAGDTYTVSATASGILGDRCSIGTPVTNTTILANIVTGFSRIVTAGRSSAAGEFSAIDLMPTSGYPVIAYYDTTNQTVKLARASAANPTTGSQWTLQTVMGTGDTNFKYSGKYISMKIDSAGYVHLAFYRNSTGDLIYMKSTNHPTDGTAYTFGNSVIIDSVGSVGVWADITLDGTNPVISYLDSSMVNTFDGIKMAYYDPTLETVSGDIVGEPDTIDGWETMNAALGYEVESVRTSAEVDTGSNFWQTAIGYSSSDYFRIAYYVK